MNRRVYLDYSATTPVRPEVSAAMTPYLAECFGNPSSIHALGRETRMAIEEARDRLRAALGGGGSLAFTGSGTEADNLAVLGFARRNPGGCIVRSNIEHKAVMESTRALVETGYDVRVAPVDERGITRLEELRALIPNDRPTLVSVMWANNETGAVQPVAEIAATCQERGALFHSDAVQALGKLDTASAGVDFDLIAVSAHKIGGPKGVGALWIREGVELEPLVYGGGHEGGLRSGTQNVAGVVGFARAAELAAAKLDSESERWQALRDRLQRGLREALPEIVVNGGDAPQRLPSVLNISVPAIDIEGLLTSLDLEGICVSSGSACTTGSVKPSHVISAMGRQGDLASNTIRFSLGWPSEESDIDYALEVFPRLVRRVRG